MSVLVVGRFGEADVGRHFSVAAHRLGDVVTELDIGAFHVEGRIEWYLRRRFCDSRPRLMDRFNKKILKLAERSHCRLLIVAGLLPVRKETVLSLRGAGIRCVNFLTDNPLSTGRRAAWLLGALPAYDLIANPRLDAVDALRGLGCLEVADVMFGYSPDVHYTASDCDTKLFSAGELLFVGYGDSQRRSFFGSSLPRGCVAHLHGGGWQRSVFRSVRLSSRPRLSVEQQRVAYATHLLSPCLVRAANRDDHVMRTFEGPAMGGAVVFQDTWRHRALFGKFLPSSAFFDSPLDLSVAIKRARRDPAWLVGLRAGASAALQSADHTYTARLKSII